jgi:acetyltransferase-like isoleucine patch superfamily enzyme
MVQRMGTQTHASRETSQQAPHPAKDAEELYRRWLQFLDDELVRHCSAERRSEIVRDQLHQLYFGRPHAAKTSVNLTSELPGTTLALSLDPMNVTLEAEYYADIDRERYARLKPLLWFWKMFDRSPIGLNHWLGLRFRCMLGRHIFEHLGAGVKIYHGVDLTYGYNLSIGDGATIRQGALLNDRGGLTIGEGAIIGSFARIYTQSYDPANLEKVALVPTTIGARARIASHAIVLAGHDVGEGEAVGVFPTLGM